MFVLQRELSEVHLLLDNVSANPTTTVAERSDVERPKMLPDDWIERICEINWPPEEDSDKAYDAALLINAKDYLNRLAHPASGSTIAFTHLVTQEDEAKRRRRRRKAEAAGEAGEESGLPGVQTRASLAQKAYPDLLAKAAKFRKWMLGMSVGLLIALVITCALSWHVAYGNAMLAELTTAQTDYDAARARVNQAESPPAGAAPGGTPAPPAATTPAAANARAAERASAESHLPEICRTPSGPEQRQACSELRGEHGELERVKRRLANWECWTCFGGRSFTAEEIADAAPVASAWANILG